MKHLILFLILFINYQLFSQSEHTVAEEEANNYIENFVSKNGGSWKKIQDYFENYLKVNRLYKTSESVEKGYLEYLRIRQEKVVLPPMMHRDKFKKDLIQVKVLKSENPLVGQPLFESISTVFNKHKDKIEKTSSFFGVTEMVRQLSAVEKPEALIIADGIRTCVGKEQISKPLYKKVIILGLFVDAIYQDEMFSKQVSSENYYRNKEEYENLYYLRIGSKLKEPEINNEEVAVEIVEVEEVEEKSDEEQIFMIVEKMPQFPGGDLGLRQYIASHIKYPEDAKKAGIEGKVYVRFVVSKTGKVTNITIARGVHKSINEEAIRVIKSLPDWTPGTQRNKPVSVWYTVPINFSLK